MIYTGAVSRDGRQMIVSRGAQTRDAFLISKFRLTKMTDWKVTFEER